MRERQEMMEAHPLMQSDAIDQLAAALANAQAEIVPVARDSQVSTGAYTYTYSSLTVVLKAVRPVLNRHGLAVTQAVVPRVEPIYTAERVEYKRDRDGNWVEQRVPVQSLGSVRTTLAHTSGQWIASELPILAPWADVQAVGAAFTYYRRIALKAIVGLAEVDDADGKLPDDADGKPAPVPARSGKARSAGAIPRSAGARGKPASTERADPRAVAQEMAQAKIELAQTFSPEPACPPNLRRYWKARGLEPELVKLVEEMGLSGRASQWSEEDRLAVHEAMLQSYPDAPLSGSKREVPF
jgi:hypothetical protein